MAIPGYRILRKIRQGGMSTVYLAIQQSVDREVAIKVMSPNLSSDPSFGSRFYREAKIVGQLSHPNIVAIYDVGSHKHYNYIAMDYLPGIPLQDKLTQGVSTKAAIKIVREIASALDYAHHRGYIHRDIKPDNILFRQDGTAVLCDFGIAKTLKGNIKMTNIGTVLGTPHYMSPEQAQGKEIDGRSDLYSLGVVFFEMLAGQVPFSGDDPVAIAVKHMTSPIPKLPRAQKAFQPIIEQMMAKKPTARFQTGQEIIAALDQLEITLNNRDENHHTLTGSTTMQAFGLIGALISNLVTAITQLFKRLMLTNIKFSNEPKPLSHKQMEDLDSFILDGDNDGELSGELADLPLIQDTIEQPAVKMPRRWLLPVLVVASVLAVALYLISESTGLLPTADSEMAELKSTIATVDLNSAITENNNSKHHDNHQTETLAAEDEIAVVSSVEPEPEPEFSLTINPAPANAKIRILNIKPRYRQGMKLTAGAYHIAVSAKDYFPQKFWLRISDNNIERTVNLEPTRRALAAGTTLQDPLSVGGNSPDFIIIPQGELTPDHGQYSVAFRQPLAVSINEITFAQYDQFARTTQRRQPDDFGWGRDHRPVIDVSHDDAIAYSQWLSQQTGKAYRLLTAQEWEYIASAGQTGSYWWGAASAAQKANCRKGCKSQYSKFFGSTTAPTGKYPANAFGLHDTAGNVAEWIDDCRQWNDEQTQCLQAWAAGGSHQDNDRDLRSDSKQNIAAEGNKYTGFRLVLEL